MGLYGGAVVKSGTGKQEQRGGGYLHFLEALEGSSSSGGSMEGLAVPVCWLWWAGDGSAAGRAAVRLFGMNAAGRVGRI